MNEQYSRSKCSVIECLPEKSMSARDEVTNRFNLSQRLDTATYTDVLLLRNRTLEQTASPETWNHFPL